MSGLAISPQAKQKANEAILITGGARSGTTIMGRLIHSFEGVEYSFEPPMMFSLFSLLDEMPAQQWKLLYETYVYEEFFLNALAGRNLNINSNDASSIYKAKSEAFVAERMEASVTKVEAERRVRNHRIAYKVPDVVPFIPSLIDLYPDTTVVVMRRGPIEVLNSLAGKGWFAPENEKANLIWPYRWCEGVQVPFWVADQDVKLWTEWGELDRCAYYYLRMNELLNYRDKQVIVDYQELGKWPESVAGDLADRLGLKFGEKTPEVIRSVQDSGAQRDPAILERLSPHFRERIWGLLYG